jgi:hypothetical protein
MLVWDMMKAPRTTRILEKVLNPVIGKSVVIYLRKPEARRDRPEVERGAH